MHRAHEPLEPGLTYRLLTTLLLLGLLLEWLILWLHAGEWSVLLQPKSLMWMTAAMLAIGLMRPRLYLFITAGVVVCMLGLFVLFRGEGEYLVHWLFQFISSLAHNLNDMLRYGIWYMSDEFRTLLLFTGWLLLAPALQSMVWHYQLSLSLVAATIVYLIFFHTMLGSDVWLELLRVIGIGLLLIALTAQYRLQRDQATIFSSGKHKRYYAISVAMLAAIISAGGLLASDSKDKQSEPVAWEDVFSLSVAEEIAAWSQQSGGMPLKNVTSSSYRSTTMAVVGYDQDDSLLGQTLQPSSGVVFYGWSPQEGYWRGEAKATYTGKGWSDSEGAVALHKIANGAEEASVELGNKGKGERIEQTITYSEPMVGMPLLQSGMKGVVLELQASDPDRKLSSYITEPTTGALYSPIADAAIKSYTLLTELPIVDSPLLNELIEPNEQLAQRIWESDMLGDYLQLPEDLPERVTALAAEISGGGWTSRYDQVKAVEQYLQESYSYSLKSRPPSEEEDFVDQFLFEQQQGYCVHFATAMVVMLRTQEIPARWVKGFQSGEAVGERTTEAGIVETQYKVTAGDAHAWVEVYFPEVGWVPFDPTPSSSAHNEQTAAWLHNAKQLGTDMLVKLKEWSSSLSFTHWSIAAAKWLWLAAAGALFICLVVGTAIYLPSIRRALHARSYAVIYRQLAENRLLLQTQRSLSLPARSKRRAALQQHAGHNQFKLQQKLQQHLYWLVDECLSSLERNIRAKHFNMNAKTWRQRIAAIADSCNAVQREQLTILLAAIEQLQYSSEMRAPAPTELSLLLHNLRPRAFASHRRGAKQRRYDELLQQQERQYEQQYKYQHVQQYEHSQVQQHDRQRGL